MSRLVAFEWWCFSPEDSIRCLHHQVVGLHSAILHSSNFLVDHNCRQCKYHHFVLYWSLDRNRFSSSFSRSFSMKKMKITEFNYSNDSNNLIFFVFMILIINNSNHLCEVTILWIDFRMLIVVDFPFIIPKLKWNSAINRFLGVPSQILSNVHMIVMIEICAVFFRQLYRSISSDTFQLINRESE